MATPHTVWAGPRFRQPESDAFLWRTTAADTQLVQSQDGREISKPSLYFKLAIKHLHLHAFLFSLYSISDSCLSATVLYTCYSRTARRQT